MNSYLGYDPIESRLGGDGISDPVGARIADVLANNRRLGQAGPTPSGLSLEEHANISQTLATRYNLLLFWIRGAKTTGQIRSAWQNWYNQFGKDIEDTGYFDPDGIQVWYDQMVLPVMQRREQEIRGAGGGSLMPRFRRAGIPDWMIWVGIGVGGYLIWKMTTKAAKRSL
jgi:hypothetical protein